LGYRLALRTRLRRCAEVFTTVACGLALALLAPLLPWPPPPFRVPLLAVIGSLLSSCHPMGTALMVTVSTGAPFGALLWQLGLCRVAPDVEFLHPVLLASATLIFVVLFVCTPGIAGPACLMGLLVPALGALLFTLGMSGLAPRAGLLNASALFAEAPCSSEGGGALGGAAAPLAFLGTWLVLAACGAAMQVLMSQRSQGAEADGAGGPGGDLVASLLPGREEEGGANLPRPGDVEGMGRYGLISKAIFADEDADLSHLTDNERQIVAVCRKDEFERDRLLWGGGLI